MEDVSLRSRRIMFHDIKGIGNQFIPRDRPYLIFDLSKAEAEMFREKDVRVKEIEGSYSLTVWLPSGFPDLTSWVSPTPGPVDIVVRLQPWQYEGLTGCKVYLKSITHSLSQ